MNRRKRLILYISVAILALTMWACGNPLEGGSDPSGSILRVTDSTVDSGVQDIFFCEDIPLQYVIATIEMRNDSRPNFEDSPTTPDGTNSFVSINRYRIDYAILNMSGTLPGVDGAGFTFGIPPDGAGTLTIQAVPEPILEYVRGNFPTVGNGQAMTVRADITIWGEDAFKVKVSTQASVTITIDDVDPCLTDIPPPDESSE